MRPLLLSALLCACATLPVRAADALLEPGEELLERGGELAMTARPGFSARVEGSRLIAWGQTEVPGDSRLQPALALADAAARSELLQAVQVGVAAVDTATQSDTKGGGAQSASSATAQATRGLLGKLPLAEHAWLRVRREGKVWLRLYSRLAVERSALFEVLRAALGERTDLAQRAMDQIERGK